MQSAEQAADAEALLLELAWRSIRHGLAAGPSSGGPHAVRLEELPPELREPGACFVTLRRDGELRGCIGSLEPTRALALDVAENAWRAAFGDPRFPPLAENELAGLELEISILGAREPLPAASEQELRRALRPGRDGLVLTCGSRRATFLPAVWSSLPEPADFLRELKRKAGLPGDYWASDLSFERYSVREIA